MKKYLIFIIVFAFSLSVFAKYEGDAIKGYWYTKNKIAKIKIYKKRGKYHGKIVWLLQPKYKNGKKKIDRHNPDPKKRKRPLIGLVILKNLEYDGDYEWEDGEIYDPNNGKSYSCEVSLEDNGDKLKVRGYIGISLIGRTQIWTKAE